MVGGFSRGSAGDGGRHRRVTRGSLGMVAGGLLPALGGACCAGLGVGLAAVGGVVGVTLGWLSPMLLGVALATAGVLILRLARGRPWRAWHRLAMIAAASYVISALVLMPALGALVAGDGSAARVLP